MATTVLFLDDDTDVLTLLGSVLESNGYYVLSASRLEDATDILKEFTPDVAVVDGLLPDGNGVDFVRELRDAGSNLPIIFLSHFFRDLESYKTLVEGLGVSRVLHKPVSPFDFLVHVQDVVGEAVVSDKVPSVPEPEGVEAAPARPAPDVEPSDKAAAAVDAPDEVVDEDDVTVLDMGAGPVALAAPPEDEPVRDGSAAAPTDLVQLAGAAEPVPDAADEPTEDLNRPGDETTSEEPASEDEAVEAETPAAGAEPPAVESEPPAVESESPDMDADQASGDDEESQSDAEEAPATVAEQAEETAVASAVVVEEAAEAAGEVDDVEAVEPDVETADEPMQEDPAEDREEAAAEDTLSAEDSLELADTAGIAAVVLPDPEDPESVRDTAEAGVPVVASDVVPPPPDAIRTDTGAARPTREFDDDATVVSPPGGPAIPLPPISSEIVTLGVEDLDMEDVELIEDDEEAGSLPPREEFATDKVVPSPLQSLTSMPVGDPKMMEGLMRLRRSYAERLEERLDELEELLEKAKADPNTRENLIEAHMVAHKMHGSAGSYGFGTVGAHAGAIEERLIQLIEGGFAADDAGSWEMLFGAMERAREEAKESIGEALGDTSPEAAVPVVGTVAVIIDNKAKLREIKELAKLEPLKVITTRKPEEVPGLADDSKIDCVLVSPHLAGEADPGRVVRRVRSVPGLDEVPIAFVGGQADLPARIAAAEVGASRFIIGDLDSAELTALVRDLSALRPRNQARVLVVDDDPDTTDLLVEILGSRGYEVEVLDQPTKVFDSIEQFRPDALLLDVMMPVVSGLQVCSMIRNSADWQDLPILLMTANPTTELRIAAFEAGADDYLTKPFVHTELAARLKVRLERQRLARERAGRDSLTGLLSRHSFLEAVQSRLAQALRTKDALALCILRLDALDLLEDTYGYGFAQRVLKELGGLLRKSLRTEDVRGLWKPDEFAMVLVGVNPQTAQAAVQRLGEAVAGLRLVPRDRDRPVPLRLHYGIAYAPGDGETVRGLFDRASERLEDTRGA